MSFDTLAVQGSNVGKVLRFDVSYDAFSTITYRWGTEAGVLDGTNEYLPHVVSMSPLSRGFGNDRQAAPGVFELIIDNTAGTYDSMARASGHRSNHRMRVRAYVVLYDTVTGYAGSFGAKQLGEFSLYDNPARDGSTLKLSFSDDILSGMTSVIDTPTVGDVQAAWISELGGDQLRVPVGLPLNTPLPLVFGKTFRHQAMPLCLHAWSSSGALKVIYLLRANGNESNGEAGAGSGDVMIEWDQPTDGLFLSDTESAQLDSQTQALRLPEDVVFSNGATTSARTVWARQVIEVEKHGIFWQVEYIEVFLLGFLGVKYAHPSDSRSDTPFDEDPNSVFGQTGFTEISDRDYGYAPGHVSIAETITGLPPSATLAYALHGLNQEATPTGAASFLYEPHYLQVFMGRRLWVDYSTSQHVCDVLINICDEYTYPAIARDTTTLTTLKAALPLPRCAVAGVLAGRNGRDLRTAISSICQSADIDVFFKWDGTLAVSGETFSSISASLSSLVDFPEHAMGNVSDRIPSVGDRGFAANFFSVGGGAPHAELPFGTVDDDQVDPDNRVVVKSLSTEWSEYKEASSAYRQLDTRAVTRLKFFTDLRGMLLELGDYFTASWSHGIVPIYTGDIFKVEALRYSPDKDSVEVEAQWRSDSTATGFPYLLDDQDLAIQQDDNGGTYTLTCNDGSGVLSTASTWDPVAKNIAVGDILILQDTSLAATVFTRFRCLRITAVSTTDITVTDDDLDFDAAAPVVVTEWEIYKGALTYSTLPGVNYPNGYGIYGKLSYGFTSYYSDGASSQGTTKANRLVSG